MSYCHDANIANVISPSHTSPSGAARSALKSPGTSTVAPQGKCLMAMMAQYIVGASSGDMYYPPTNHILPPYYILKLKTLTL